MQLLELYKSRNLVYIQGNLRAFHLARTARESSFSRKQVNVPFCYFFIFRKEFCGLASHFCFLIFSALRPKRRKAKPGFSSDTTNRIVVSSVSHQRILKSHFCTPDKRYGGPCGTKCACAAAKDSHTRSSYRGSSYRTVSYVQGRFPKSLY